MAAVLQVPETATTYHLSASGDSGLPQTHDEHKQHKLQDQHGLPGVAELARRLREALEE